MKRKEKFSYKFRIIDAVAAPANFKIYTINGISFSDEVYLKSLYCRGIMVNGGIVRDVDNLAIGIASSVAGDIPQLYATPEPGLILPANATAPQVEVYSFNTFLNPFQSEYNFKTGLKVGPNKGTFMKVEVIVWEPHVVGDVLYNDVELNFERRV